MKRYLFCLLCLSLSNVYAQDTEKDFETNIAKTIAYVDSHQNAVWPGFKLAATPVISVFDDDLWHPTYAHLYAYGSFSPVNPDWQHINMNGKPAYYLDHDAYQLTGSDPYGGAIVWGTYRIDDQAAFVYVNSPSLMGNLESISTFVHIRFDDEYNDSYPYFDYENSSFNQPEPVKLTYLEFSILKKYLQDGNPQNDELLKDAVAVHQYRLSILDEHSRSYHKILEKTESIPAYVGVKSLKLPQNHDIEFFPQACDGSNLAVGVIYNCEGRNNEKLPGIVYGRALDRHRKTWKIEAMAQKKSIEELLQEAYSISDVDAAKRTEKIISNGEYDYTKISESVDKVLRPYLDDMHTQIANYEMQPGIEMQVYYPEPASLRSHLDNNKKTNQESKEYRLNYNVSMVTDLFDEYQFILDRNNALAIDFYHTPVVFFGGLIRDSWFIKFKIPADARIIMDGNSMTVGDFVNARKYASFEKMKIETPYVNTYLRGLGGFLDARSGVLKLKTTYVYPVSKAKNQDGNERLIAQRKKMHDQIFFGIK